MQELKPCPFCGGEVIREVDEGNFTWRRKCMCSNCGASTESYQTWDKANAAWNKRIGDKEYLLNHFRQSGVFKCFECLYCRRIETDLGNMYKCVHDGVAVNCFEKEEWDVMRGCACFWFEPKGKAGEAVALRQAAIFERVRELAHFANEQIPHNYPGNETALEKRYARILKDLRDLGVWL